MKTCDVAIVGGGIVGSMTALLLSAANKNLRITLFDPLPHPGSAFATGLGVFWPSPNDPPTRAVVAHGHDMALFLGDFCQQGRAFFEQEIAPLLPSVTFKKVRTVRFGVQEFERIELTKAVSLGLNLTQGMHAECFEETHPSLALRNASAVPNALSRQLLAQGVTFEQARVVALTESSNGCTLGSADGQEFSAEVVIMANSHAIGALLTQYQDILVPMTDLVLTYKTHALPKLFAPNSKSDSGLEARLRAGLCFRAASGHVAGHLMHNETDGSMTLTVSGPRFLLPSAGVGVDLTKVTKNATPLPVDFARATQFFEASVWPAVLRTLTEGKADNDKTANNSNMRGALGSDLWSLQALGFEQQRAELFVDCLPCDELPLIGELGKLGRILGGAGWLGCGFSAGCQTARVLASLVTQGHSPHSHPMLSPRRFHTG